MVSQITLHNDEPDQSLQTESDHELGEIIVAEFEYNIKEFAEADASPKHDDHTPSTSGRASDLVPVVSRWTGQPSVRPIDTRANLIEELDSIYDGGKDRCVMRLREEETVLTVGNISDRERFFTLVWNRYILEHGDIGSRQEEYLIGFFNQYGPILHRADACYPVSCHLIRLYRGGILDRSRRRRVTQTMTERQKRVGLDLCLKLAKVWSAMKAKWDKEALTLTNDSTGS